jgi:hypothetical protein
MPFFTDTDPGGFRSDTASAPPLPKFAPDASDWQAQRSAAPTPWCRRSTRIANSGPFEPDPTHNPLDT